MLSLVGLLSTAIDAKGYFPKQDNPKAKKEANGKAQPVKTKKMVKKSVLNNKKAIKVQKEPAKEK